MTPKKATTPSSHNVVEKNLVENDPDVNIADAGVHQFFGFTPGVFCDAVYQSVDDYLADGLDAMEVALLPSFVDDESRGLLKGMNDAFMDLLNNVFDKNLDKFEIYIKRNIFVLPEGIDEVRCFLHFSLTSLFRLFFKGGILWGVEDFILLRDLALKHST